MSTTEYRQVNKNSKFLADIGFVDGINLQQQIKKIVYLIIFKL